MPSICRRPLGHRRRAAFCSTLASLVVSLGVACGVATRDTVLSLAAAGGISLALVVGCDDVGAAMQAPVSLAQASPLASFDESGVQARPDPVFVAVERADVRASADVPGADHAERQQPCPDSSFGEASWKDEVIAACMTREHNRARSRLAVSPPLSPLTWSTELAKAAREWVVHLAQRCQGIEPAKRVRYGQALLRAHRSARGAASPPRRWSTAGWQKGNAGLQER